ncbi:tyrosine-type recombinase/integrase [Anaerococcus sp.]|uniref:tyrosine-type recombinase/integrase n=1 Tax=Anaerococcus sp. TaxID=1872515 RepID=UPI0029028886|nr:tyrosine-type recombinase/integrase [Anaerococcus sp.]MDU3212351.1 tyrosine-type recombinase/integrase [Anaerococcus sp.]
MTRVKTKYPCVYTDKNGKIYYQVELGIDKFTGKRVTKKSRKNKNGKYFKSLREAYNDSIKIKTEFLQSQGNLVSGMSMKYFIDKYYVPYYKGIVQKSTFSTKIHVINIVKDYFSEKEIDDIKVRDCELFRVYLLGKDDYSQMYSSMIYGTFRTILDYAVRLEFLPENISKRTKAISKGRANVKYWNLQEFQRVISTISIDDFYEHMCFVMIWLYFNTGIRVGEGQALTWDKVNLLDKKLKINSTLEYKNRKNFRVKPFTKTEAGNRIITLDSDTVDILKKWKNRQEKYNIKNFVISYCDLPIGRNTIHRIIKRYAKAAGVHSIQAKGLRHSHASYLINQFNADILVVSRRLGHSSPEITLKYYSHLWSRGDELIAKDMEGIIKFETQEQSQINMSKNQHYNNDTLPKTFQEKEMMI